MLRACLNRSDELAEDIMTRRLRLRGWQVRINPKTKVKGSLCRSKGVNFIETPLPVLFGACWRLVFAPLLRACTLDRRTRDDICSPLNPRTINHSSVHMLTASCSQINDRDRWAISVRCRPNAARPTNSSAPAVDR